MTILVTGATGFVGSALVAKLLFQGHDVKALSRNDLGGQRTKGAVQTAADGFGITITPDSFKRLKVINADINRLEQTLSPKLLEDVEVVWHVAADMRYSTKNVLEVFNANVVGTSILYQMTAEHSKNCSRMYYVSTAYTANASFSSAGENLHFHPHCVNAYQMSKWNAEQALSNLQRKYKLPITIFRPSIIIGHQNTGWSTGTGFGYYMFVDALYAAKLNNAKDLRINLVADSEPDLVSVDVVVDNAVALIANNEKQKSFEIVHCVGGQQLTTRELVEFTSNIVGVKCFFGLPKTTLEKRMDRVMGVNKFFQQSTWNFEQKRLKHILGGQFNNFHLDENILHRIVRYYFTYVIHRPLEQAKERLA